MLFVLGDWVCLRVGDALSDCVRNTAPRLALDVAVLRTQSLKAGSALAHESFKNSSARVRRDGQWSVSAWATSSARRGAHAETGR